ncbi:hypothetical protein JCM4814A_15350 [Streptomyces phaeofaciens JCM 4814]|uniref:Uncharacterized protein n=1 Tax=Streptomyces phaeofaciens TaxID=68254 RepID=A0A918HKH2_9ACTN|nr:hypothetical protein GCM10010226_62260 [Streptomyces phaeofaciens]
MHVRLPLGGGEEPQPPGPQRLTGPQQQEQSDGRHDAEDDDPCGRELVPEDPVADPTCRVQVPRNGSVRFRLAGNLRYGHHCAPKKRFAPRRPVIGERGGESMAGSCPPNPSDVDEM